MCVGGSLVRVRVLFPALLGPLSLSVLTRNYNSSFFLLQCEEMVNVWFTGKLPGRVGEFWSPTCKVEAGPGVVTGWGDYSNHSGLVDWYYITFNSNSPTLNSPATISCPSCACFRYPPYSYISLLLRYPVTHAPLPRSFVTTSFFYPAHRH